MLPTQICVFRVSQSRDALFKKKRVESSNKSLQLSWWNILGPHHYKLMTTIDLTILSFSNRDTPQQ